MKRRDLVMEIERMGAEMVRFDAKHLIYLHPRTGKSEPVPRDPEINEFLARKIIKSLAPPDDTSG